MRNLYCLLMATSFLIMILSCNKEAKTDHEKSPRSNLRTEVDSLDIQLAAISKASVIPGFAASVLHGEETIYSKGFGYADVDGKHEFSPQTVNTIASISKTFVGVSIMKLVEEGKLQLDDPVNDYLPFEISNPHFPETTITVRHLVTHTSSLNDSFDDGEIRPSRLIEQSKYSKEEMPEELAEDIHYWDGTDLPLETYLAQAFTAGGKWYAESNFSNFRPGDQYEYSNEGANLAGLIVERVSGMPFAEFTDRHIFQPLGMVNSYWVYRDLGPSVSKLYTQYEEEHPGKVFEFPRAVDSGQPCGDLKSNADDLSKYLIEMMKGFRGEGKILNAESYQTLLTSQLGRDKFSDDDESVLNDEYDVGVLWAISKTGVRLHKGGSIGVFSIVYFDPESNMGVVSYCNLAHPDFGKVVNTLRSFEQRVGNLLVTAND